MGLEEQIWTAYRTDVLRFLSARTGDPELARELVQETLLKAFEARHSLRSINRLRPWLFSIARNLLTDRHRAAGRQVTVEEARPSLLASEPPEEFALVDCVRALVAGLPPHYRAAVEMIDLEGAKQRVVAERLGLSLSGAKSRVQRGRQMLKERLFACCPLEFNNAGLPVACRSCE